MKLAITLLLASSAMASYIPSEAPSVDVKPEIQTPTPSCTKEASSVDAVIQTPTPAAYGEHTADASSVDAIVQTTPAAYGEASPSSDVLPEIQTPTPTPTKKKCPPKYTTTDAVSVEPAMQSPAAYGYKPAANLEFNSGSSHVVASVAAVLFGALLL